MVAGAASSSAGPPGQEPPTNTSPPTITGLPEVGATLTGNPGTWTGPGIKYSLQWVRCDGGGGACAAIAGATGDTYPVPADSVGSTLRLVVVATNKRGSATAVSDPTAPVTTPPLASSDAVAPSTPTELTVVATTADTISLWWQASNDNVEVTGYEVSLDGAVVARTTVTNYTFENLLCGARYGVGVRARDAAGNVSEEALLASTTAACSDVGESLPSLLPASTGPVFFVSTSGSDANPGSFEAPWRTVQRALGSLRPGESVLVRGGTYAEDLWMSRSGSESAPVTVAAFPGERVVLRPASTSGNTYALVVYSAAFVRVQGFVIEGSSGTSAANVYVTGSSHHVELSGNEIRFGQDQGVYADAGTSHVFVLGNRIHGHGLNRVPGQHQNHGIYIKGSHDLIANNVIYNHPYGFGLQIYPDNHDTVVVDNTIAGSGHSSIVVGGFPGVYNITIRNNILYEGKWGVQMDSTCPTGPVTIERNLIAGYRYGPVMGGCSSVSASDNILAEPAFVDYSRGDLHTQATSPAVDQAIPSWSARTDLDGRNRPQGNAPDIGAYER